MMTARQGSVLMEFVIVLPLYMLLLGFAFVTGELSLHAIRLAGGADRTRALSPAAFEAFKTAAAPGQDPDADAPLSYAGDGGGSARVSSYSDAAVSWFWDESFEGPWSKVVAATVSDYCTLTPLTRGFVAFWYRDTRERLARRGDSGLEVGGVLDEMIRDSGVIGRVRGDDGLGMTGRERDASDGRALGFFTLVRSRLPETEGRRTWRAWPAGALADGDAWRKVCEEGFLAHDLTALAPGGSNVAAAAPEEAANRAIYETKEGLHGWTR